MRIHPHQLPRIGWQQLTTHSTFPEVDKKKAQPATDQQAPLQQASTVGHNIPLIKKNKERSHTQQALQ